MSRVILRCALVAFVGLGSIESRSDAGSLNPPVGPVAPTMKTLVEIEPRTMISSATTPGDASATFIIAQPGSYYLGGNLAGESGKSGIVIAASNVSLDLNGFTLQGVAGSLDGIRPSGNRTNIIITNGIVAGWGGTGVATYAAGGSGSYASYTRIEGITAAQNTAFGIRAGVASVVSRCIARSNGNTGIILTNSGGVATECLAIANSADGFTIYDGSSMIACASHSNTGSGVECGNSNHVIRDCAFQYNSDGGIARASNTTISGCNVANNTGHGITFSAGCHITGNLVNNNSLAGLLGLSVAPSGDNRIEGNEVHLNGGAGIDLTNNTGNMVFRNTLRRNTNNTIVNAAGSSAPTSNNAATAGPWHNIITP